MSQEFYSIQEGKYYPNQKNKLEFNKSSDNEFLGDYWKVWFEGEKYFLEHDVGHFASKFVTVEIQKEDYEGLKNGSISYKRFIDSEKTK